MGSEESAREEVGRGGNGDMWSHKAGQKIITKRYKPLYVRKKVQDSSRLK